MLTIPVLSGPEKRTHARRLLSSGRPAFSLTAYSPQIALAVSPGQSDECDDRK
jgi:hypothetical protein